MDDDVVAYLLMALGVAEMFFGIFLRQKGVNMGDDVPPRKKHGTVMTGTFVAVSGGVLAFIGLAVLRYGLP
ncbi:MAG: hypothetical protein SF172_12590 [Burkholderiales bacterium]|nr:hypothetical protein [Burkholderiales bacterium]